MSARAALSLIFALLLPPAQALAFFYGDIPGTDVDFLGVNDTTTSPGDPDRLFGGVIGPIATGNQLLFFPTAFSASAQGGAPSADLTSALLTTTIESTNSLFFLKELVVTEFGNVDLSGTGTASASVSLLGQLTVLEINFATVAPVIIPFSGTFSPNADGSFSLPGDSGSRLWNGGFSIDIAGALIAEGLDPFATKAVLQMNNILDANALAGSTALIQKDVVDGPAISVEVIPEPATGLLLGLGLLGLAMPRRLASRSAGSSTPESRKS